MGKKNLRGVSFTEEPSTSNPKKTSFSTDYPSSSNKKDSDNDSKNSLNDLNKDPKFETLRKE